MGYSHIVVLYKSHILSSFGILFSMWLKPSLFLQCARNVSLEEFFADIRSQPPARLFVIGCGCSIATEPVAEISHFWEVVMVSSTYECSCTVI